MPAFVSPFTARIDMRIRIAGPVLLLLIGVMFFRLKLYLDLSGIKLFSQLTIALTAGFIGWELTRAAALLIQKKLRGTQRMRQRLFWLIIALIVLSHFGYALRYIVHIIIDQEQWRWPSLLNYSDVTGVVMFYTTVILSIYEGGYFWQQWKQAIAEKERLIQSHWQAKYDLLKSQINPHFLFNSLNSLSSLITENPQQAEKFADEMSNVYRYLLRNNDADLVTLAAELKFIRSYGNLLTTRYGPGFKLDVDIKDPGDDWLLPSLTLQLLVENAVKHNIVLKKQPLEVTINMEGDRLWVINNVQKKNIIVPSNGVGLANIDNRFRLLHQRGITIEKTPETFKVIVPLIRESIET
jgi:hypothetical protein